MIAASDNALPGTHKVLFGACIELQNEDGNFESS